MPTCENCQGPFPNRVIIQGKLRVLNRRKYCLTCSPFGQHNTKNLNKVAKILPTQKNCSKCRLTKIASCFYKRRDGTGLSAYCRNCTNQETTNRCRRLKQQCVEYKGGKCEKCGYNRYIGALDFHHNEPEQKRFGIAMRWATKFTEDIKAEISKCILLCSNCHREEHARRRGLI
jgi:hypothetical protein